MGSEEYKPTEYSSERTIKELIISINAQRGWEWQGYFNYQQQIINWLNSIWERWIDFKIARASRLKLVNLELDLI